MSRSVFWRMINGILLVGLTAPFAYGAGTIINGFQIEPWLTGAGDLRGVSVGPGGSFGSDPFVYSYTQQAVLRVTGPETAQIFATGFGAGTGRMVFDTSGTFGKDLYLSGPLDGAGPNDPIYRVASNGSVSVFQQGFNSLTKGVAFGGGFGNSLFVVDAGGHQLQRIDALGNATPFGSGISSDSWEDDLLITNGGSFGNYAYITDGIHNQILRMSSSGSTAAWTLVQGGLSLAEGEGVFGDYLYVGTFQGNIVRVDAQGNVTQFASGFGTQSAEGNFRGLAIDGNVMWATSDTGTLYRITAVPEPSTALACGLLAILLPAGLRTARFTQT